MIARPARGVHKESALDRAPKGGYPGTMANRSRDWLRQAEQDLGHARRSRDLGDHDRACFAAQQAAEKAVKALHLAFGQEA